MREEYAVSSDGMQMFGVMDLSSGEIRLLPMPEVGLVRFAQVALEIAQATVPRYRTAF